jgi:hypothetical protein
MGIDVHLKTDVGPKEKSLRSEITSSSNERLLSTERTFGRRLESAISQLYPNAAQALHLSPRDGHIDDMRHITKRPC